MDIKAILKAHGIDEGIDSLADAIKKQIGEEFVPNRQYTKKAKRVDELMTQIKELQDNTSNSEGSEWESKYNELKAEYDGFKTNIETEKVNTVKANKVKETLKANGYNQDKVIDLLMKGIDLGSLELDGDDLKGFDIASIDANYGDFKSKEIVQGTNPIAPPTSDPKAITRESLKNMSTAEINANWEAISQQLGNL